jgi:hypothetical protein
MTVIFRFWEAGLASEDKPKPEDPRSAKEAFIKAKYCDRTFLLPVGQDQAVA